MADCPSNKIKFNTAVEAREYAREHAANGRLSHGKLHAYECTICGGYHLTRLNKKQQRLLTKRREKKRKARQAAYRRGEDYHGK